VLKKVSARWEERNNFILGYVCSPRRTFCGYWGPNERKLRIIYGNGIDVNILIRLV